MMMVLIANQLEDLLKVQELEVEVEWEEERPMLVEQREIVWLKKICLGLGPKCIQVKWLKMNSKCQWSKQALMEQNLESMTSFIRTSTESHLTLDSQEENSRTNSFTSS